MYMTQVVLNKFRHHDKDTGSTEVQIISLTEDIRRLTEHYKRFPKDANKRGLMVKVGRRQAFLNYLKKHNEARYQDLIKSLELR
jgi:small subunit ribosomal protein S15